jgi:glycine/D-amino acid oxidase-like deaminating enzyme
MLRLGISRLVADFPMLTGVKVARAWGGVIDTAPDLVPIISRTPKLEGLIIAAGMSGHGFALGPGVGRLVSEMALDETPYTDIGPYRLERFSDGSKMHRPDMM